MKRNLLIHRFANQNKKKYKIYLSANPTETEGDCDPPAPAVKDPVIRLRKTLMRPHRTRRQLSVIIEEMLHAHDFNLTEKVVRKYAANTMKILYKLGWRWRPEECLKVENFHDQQTLLAMLAWRRKNKKRSRSPSHH